MTRKSISASACLNFALAVLLVAFSSHFTALAQHGSLQAAQPKQAPIVREAAAQLVDANNAADADCDQLLKASVSDPHLISGVTGSADLCIDRNYATVSEWAENLEPGH